MRRRPARAVIDEDLAREAASAADDIATEARKTTPGAAGGGAGEAR